MQALTVAHVLTSLEVSGVAHVLTSLEVSGVAQIASPIPSSPKHQRKMFCKVISSFRLEADSLPGREPITTVNERH